MSWIARSLVNSLRGDEDGGGHHEASVKEGNTEGSGSQEHEDDEPSSPSRRVKEDLSELTKSITRQFWGVASFLAPPPDIQSNRGRLSDSPVSAASGGSDESSMSKSPRITGFRSDFAELGGKFKSGISMLSNTKAVSEISKIASTLLPFADDEDEGEDEADVDPSGGAVGITEDVLLFVRSITMHPETWLDFPLLSEDEDSDDFKLSDAQQKHGLAVERIEPRLAALRIELCPSHMSESCFWKIYFVLLHSRLNKDDAENLSTPQIVQAREMLLQDLHSRVKPVTARSAQNSYSHKDSEHPAVPGEDNISIIPVITAVSPQSSPPPTAEEVSVAIPIAIPVADIETEKHQIETTVVTNVDKSVTEEDPPVHSKIKDLRTLVSIVSEHRDEGDEDDWLDEEAGEAGGSGENALPLGNDEEVSFSDLEEDIDSAVPKFAPSQVKESKGWVQLNSKLDSPTKNGKSTGLQDKDEWLNLDEIDVE